MNPIVISNWREKVVFSTEGPQPQSLVATSKLKSVLVGLEPGQNVPVHPAPAAVYHFLDGSGWMLVDGERLPVQAGATIVVPEGALRGVEADTRLSFLGTHSGEKH
jgi:quercetin dioxygenase-like cupin family protein